MPGKKTAEKNKKPINVPWIKKLITAQWPWIFILALAVRLIYFYQIQDNPFFENLISDEKWYDDWAKKIAAGDLIGDRVFFQGPLYPYLLGIFYAVFGDSSGLARLFQFITGSLSAVLVFLTANKVFNNPKTAVIAGVLYALYPVIFFYEGLLLKEGALGMFLTNLSLLLIVEATRRATYKSWLLAGTITGLTTLVRENMLFSVPFMILWMILAFRDYPVNLRLKFAGCLLLGVGVSIAPVTIRNWHVSKSFVLITYQGGPVFYIGNNIHADGIYQPLRPGRGSLPYEELDAVDIAQKNTGKKLNPAQVSQYWMKRGLSSIFRHPAKYVKLMARKFVIFWNNAEVPDVIDFYFIRRSASLLKIPLTFGVIATLGLLGMVFCRGCFSDKRPLYLFYVLVLTNMTSVLLFFVFGRFRIIIVPLLILFASPFIVYFIDAVKFGKYRQLIKPLVLGAAFFVFTSHRLESFNPGLGHGNLGVIYAGKAQGYRKTGQHELAMGEYGKAIAEYKKALKYNPGEINLYKNLADAYLKTGQHELAIQGFNAVLKILVRSENVLSQERLAEIHNDLGLAYKRTGKYEAAAAQFKKAVGYDKSLNAPHVNLGIIYKKLKRYDAAAQEFLKAIELAPDNEVAYFNLGNLFRDKGDFDKAAFYYDKTIEISPSGLAASLARKNKQKLQ